MMRIADLEHEAAEQRRAAEAAAATRAALAATQTKSTAGGFREGCLVKLHGLTDSIGLQQGAFDVPMAKYNGRMGRVVEYAPSWLMKAGADGLAGESPDDH
jgi:septal ring factor EnvC (AmiA/AmiB activator)